MQRKDWSGLEKHWMISSSLKKKTESIQKRSTIKQKETECASADQKVEKNVDEVIELHFHFFLHDSSLD